MESISSAPEMKEIILPQKVTRIQVDSCKIECETHLSNGETSQSHRNHYKILNGFLQPVTKFYPC